MAISSGSLISLGLSAKLQEPWSSESIVSSLNPEALVAIQKDFALLDPAVKVQILLSMLSLRKIQFVELRTELEELIKLAASDQDEWVQVMASMLRDVPAAGGMASLNLDAVNNETFSKTFSKIQKKVLEDGPPVACPLEYAYLSPSLVPEDAYKPPDPGKHFKFKEKPDLPTEVVKETKVTATRQTEAIPKPSLLPVRKNNILQTLKKSRQQRQRSPPRPLNQKPNPSTQTAFSTTRPSNAPVRPAGPLGARTTSHGQGAGGVGGERRGLQKTNRMKIIDMNEGELIRKQQEEAAVAALKERKSSVHPGDLPIGEAINGSSGVGLPSPRDGISKSVTLSSTAGPTVADVEKERKRREMVAQREAKAKEKEEKEKEKQQKKEDKAKEKDERKLARLASRAEDVSESTGGSKRRRLRHNDGASQGLQSADDENHLPMDDGLLSPRRSDVDSDSYSRTSSAHSSSQSTPLRSRSSMPSPSHPTLFSPSGSSLPPPLPLHPSLSSFPAPSQPQPPSFPSNAHHPHHQHHPTSWSPSVPSLLASYPSSSSSSS
eukprot:CAMPEP_0184670388 /NCGR_PEP_ID=MMETSP0308-20130426/81960_1 /TAXON_ID=38269 /ORGANISM="Gloeochaete witrockiana, Strain SAG 46.84" /LENGTH=548 /DNA_ID=CAMNT_0027117103 /DNA_START=1052 /DNA_END=2694 /DNA_ORIENTATION=-